MHAAISYSFSELSPVLKHFIKQIFNEPLAGCRKTALPKTLKLLVIDSGKDGLWINDLFSGLLA